MYNVNQVNQLFVVKSVCTTGEPTNVGDIKVCKNKDNMLYFKYMGKGGLIRSDVISLDVVNGSHDLRGKLALSSEMAKTMNYVSLAINAGTGNENIIAGQEYAIRVSLPHLYDEGDENITTKYSHVRANSSDTASTLTFKLAKNLYDNLSRNEKKSIFKIKVCKSNAFKELTDISYVEGLSTSTTTAEGASDGDWRYNENGEVLALTVTSGTPDTYAWSAVTVAGFIIEALPQPWERGLMPQIDVDMEVSNSPITKNYDDFSGWVSIKKNGLVTALASVIPSIDSVKNGKKVADLEYFLMGERGDQYRMIGWPNYVKTNYMISDADIDNNVAYDIASIHYSFIGHNEDNKRGEKELTFAMSDATNHALAKALITQATYGINAVAGITLIDGTAIS